MAGPPPRHDQGDKSQYPLPPGEEDDRSRAIPYHPRPPMASGAVTLPSMQDPHGAWGPADPRAVGYGASPSSANGYPPPPNGAQPPPGSYSPGGRGGYPPPPGSHQYLPPVQPHSQEGRPSYPPPPPDPRQPQYYPQQRPPVPYSANGHPTPPPYQFQGYPPERGPGPYSPGNYQPGHTGPMIQQSAPRQRTSIACRYCRRRKIRCSGYQHSPGGKCTNCIKMNQECVFQPVSASSSTAFVPVSALPGGVPPGTQLFGAYGQPLNASSNMPPGGPPGQYQASPPQFDQPLPSPTGSFGAYPEERAEAGMRRQRPPEDDHGRRLPPPTTFPDDNQRRRSPSSSSSPRNMPPYHQPMAPQPPQPVPPQAFNRTPPPRGSPPTSGASATSVMSLGNIMDSGPTASPGNDVTRNMMDRLNRRAK